MFTVAVTRHLYFAVPVFADHGFVTMPVSSVAGGFGIFFVFGVTQRRVLSAFIISCSVSPNRSLSIRRCRPSLSYSVILCNFCISCSFFLGTLASECFLDKTDSFFFKTGYYNIFNRFFGAFPPHYKSFFT